MSAYPSDVQGKIEAKMEERLGVTGDDIDANFDELFARAKANPGVEEAGRRWYEDAGNEGRRLGREYGLLSEEHGIAVVAACSPGMDWDDNIAIANAILEVNKAHPNWSEGKVARAARKQLGIGLRDYHGLENGVRLARGADIEHGLGNGTKVRSFFDNMADPHGRGGREVTTDKHMFNGSRGRLGPASDVKRRDYYPDDWAPQPTGDGRVGVRAGSITNVGGSPSYDGADLGVHPRYADSIRRIADREGMQPCEVQAMIWIQQRAEWPRSRTQRHTAEVQAATDAYYQALAERGS